MSKRISQSLAATIIFSAKESLFKALYPSVEVFFDFEYAQLIEVDISNKLLTFQIKPIFSAKYQLINTYQVYFEFNQSFVKTLLIT